MGGRAKSRDSSVPDSFGWVSELSESRLAGYGLAAQSRYISGAEDPSRKTGSFDAVWQHVASEYRERHGEEAFWSPNYEQSVSAKDARQMSFDDVYREWRASQRVVQDVSRSGAKDVNLRLANARRRSDALYKIMRDKSNV